MNGLERIVREHAFFADLRDDFCNLIGGCGKNVRFDAGAYLFREGGAADAFFLIREGRVALEMAVPGQTAITFQTLGEGEVVGVSWLVPPYRWMYNAKATEPTRALSLDASCLRNKSEADHDLGYEMMKRFVPVLAQRLHATQMQILDVYGTRV